jgi:transposase
MNDGVKKVIAPAIKAKIATEALREVETTGQLASKYAVHPVQIGFWKKQAQRAIEQTFAQKREKDDARQREDTNNALFQKIGKLEVENEYLKKKIGLLE